MCQAVAYKVWFAKHLKELLYDKHNMSVGIFDSNLNRSGENNASMRQYYNYLKLNILEGKVTYVPVTAVVFFQNSLNLKLHWFQTEV